MYSHGKVARGECESASIKRIEQQLKVLLYCDFENIKNSSVIEMQSPHRR